MIEKSIKDKAAHQDYLIELIAAEIAFRNKRSRKINITISHFPYIKTIKYFDFLSVHHQKRPNQEFSHSLLYRKQSQHHFIGSSSVGKTYLSTTISIEVSSNVYQPTLSFCRIYVRNLSSQLKKIVLKK